jgi:hypothetical protein
LTDFEEYEIMADTEKPIRILIGEVFAHLTTVEAKQRTQKKLDDENGI